MPTFTFLEWNSSVLSLLTYGSYAIIEGLITSSSALSEKSLFVEY